MLSYLACWIAPGWCTTPVRLCRECYMDRRSLLGSGATPGPAVWAVIQQDVHDRTWEAFVSH